MSWFALKKAKTIVYLPDNEYKKFLNEYAEKNQWSVSDKIASSLSGTARNKEKKRFLYNYIIDSMTKEWKHDRKSFQEKYSFVYRADNIKKHLYELIWSFCEFNPRYQMLKNMSGTAIRPTYVDADLSVTYGKDFFICESHAPRRKDLPESQYRIQTDTIVSLYGNMMDFRIAFENGIEYRFQTFFDGRKTFGSISVDIGDLSK